MGSNYFIDKYYCKSMQSHLQKIADVLLEIILPAVSDFDDGPPIYISEEYTSSWEETEFQSYIRNFETCIHLQSIYHTWEQQVISTLWCELGRGGYFEKRTKHGGKRIDEIDYPMFSDALIAFGFDMALIGSWDKISKIREIINVIKHGDGRALKTVKENFKDIVGYDSESGFNMVSFDKNSILDENLAISIEHFNEYVACFISFWDEIQAAHKDTIEF